MSKVIYPAICAIICIGALVGPDGVVTGMIAIKTIMVAVSSYVGCCLTDWIDRKWLART